MPGNAPPAPRSATVRLAVSGLLLAAGVLLPQVFHLLGGPATGATFLPMHLPVLLGGLLLGPGPGAALGLLCPALSFAVTGMPAPARLPFMVVELAVYGLAAGVLDRVLRRRLSRPLLASLVALLGAQLAGRAAYAAALWLAAWLFGQAGGPALAVTATVAGLPGLVVQWVCLPPLCAALDRGGLRHDV